MIPHGWSSAIGLAADLHFLAGSAENELCIAEYMPTPHVMDILLDDPFVLDEAGRLAVPQLPGFGIRLDWDKVVRCIYPFTGKIL